jgi:hypothetical protein
MSTPDEYRSQQRALVRLVRQGQLTTTEALWRLERLGGRPPLPPAAGTPQRHTKSARRGGAALRRHIGGPRRKRPSKGWLCPWCGKRGRRRHQQECGSRPGSSTDLLTKKGGRLHGSAYSNQR